MAMMQRPYLRLRLSAVGWWLISVLAVCCAGAAVWAAGSLLRVHPQQAFVGTLRSSQAPLAITLPAGAIVQEVLVAEDDMVVAGQTLLVYDQDALAQHLRMLEDELFMARFERSCAMDHSVVQDLARWDQEMPPELMAKLRLSAEECVTQHQQITLTLRGLSQQEQVLADRARLIEQHVLALQAETLTGGAQAPPKTQAVISALLAKSELDEMLTDLRFQIEAEAAAMRQNQIEASAAKEAEIQRLENTQAALLAFQATPRLATPIGGSIGRLRLPPAGVPLSHEVAIMEIQPRDQDPFVVHMDVPLDVADTIAPGAVFSLTVSGLDLRDQMGLKAIWRPIASAATPDGSMMRVSLPLTQGSKRLLAARQNRMGLATKDAAAHVQFHQMAVPFWPAALDVLASIGPKVPRRM